MQHSLLYVSWLATDDPAKGHLFSIPSALISYEGPEKIWVAGLSSCQLEGVSPILDRAVFRRGFTFRDEKLAHKEAVKLANFAVVNNIETVVIYEGAFFELEVARHFSNIVDTCSIVVNLFSGSNWGTFFESASEPTLSEFKKRFLQTASLTVSVETEALADLINSKLKHECPVFPVFSCLDRSPFARLIEEKPTWSGSASGVICVSVGSENHLNFTEALLGRLCEAERSLEVIVILQSQSNLGDFEAVRLESIFGKCGLKIFHGILSDSTNSQILASSDVVLFTYDKNKYKLKSSGRVQDALIMECVPVVENGTALVSQIRLAGNEEVYTFERDNMSSVERALHSALNHKSSLRGLGISDFVSWSIYPAKTKEGNFIHN